MLLVKVDTASRDPLYRQITASIRELIDSGTLAAGERLPPTRVLAARLEVNRSTVMRAYQDLWALGYLEARPGSFSTVRRRTRSIVTVDAPAAAAFNWGEAVTAAARLVHRERERYAAGQPDPGTKDIISFAGLSADRDLSPVDDLRRVVNRVLAMRGRTLLDYGDAAGLLPLREAISRRMRTHGVAVDPEEVLVTSGAQHALQLVLQLLAEPGTPVVVESPTYAAVLPLFRFHGVRLVPVPMTEEGLDLDVLEDVLGREHPAFVYTMPNFHNPTGVTTSQPHRERLLALCERHHVPIVEDGFEEEMKYFGRAVLPIKSMDGGGLVIYVGTFSKVLFPGLRVGWIAASRECVSHLSAITRFASLSSNTLAQGAMAELCLRGTFEGHLRRVHTAYRRRMQTALRAFREHLPAPPAGWTEPAGGYLLWLNLSGIPCTEEDIHRAMVARGVTAARGSLFFPSPPAEPHFRLSISNLTEPLIEEGARRLGAAITDVLKGRTCS